MSQLRRIERIWRRARLAGLALRRRLAPDPRASSPQHGFYESIWREAAAELGADLEGLGAGVREIRRGARRTRVRGSQVMLDDPVTLRLAGEKPLVHTLLSRAGLPVPAHAAFHLDAMEIGEAFLRRQRGACVVKPARGTGGGDGVTTGVASPRQLRRAALEASLFGRELLIEAQVPGDAYRLLYLEGELLDAVRRRPPQVEGDGRHSLRELIALENRRRIQGRSAVPTDLIALDADCRGALRRAGLSLRSVPAAGARIRVKGASNAGGREESESVRELIGKDLRSEAGRAAEALGVRLAGVDVITPDPGRSLHDCGGCITEVNTTPGLRWHYLIRNPETGVRVAVPILARLLA